MNFAALSAAARDRGLAIRAALHPAAADPDLPAGTGTLLLLGPDEPGFWARITGSAEWQDGGADPVDRWSRRVVGDWAGQIGATALFPFGGPPFRPFIGWALASGWVHASPVSLLVHAEAGLWLSFRGALALPGRIALPEVPANPCITCPDQPCRTACPVSALNERGYDVPGCKSFLRSKAGQSCMTHGCQVRTACPVGQAHGRLVAHSAYHMAQFV
ncbi:ferredoxin [Pseudooceanicola sp.]|uniref:ferredoxin n=1 Tax=Pseudooceanicola sp. TaxID=1914328 RepID=UPI0026111640|nr:ferredoxin [Pseudooceanicola sp.]MDF1856941.1 ferredoxin [Pseudooceanicola sp.]